MTHGVYLSPWEKLRYFFARQLAKLELHCGVKTAPLRDWLMKGLNDDDGTDTEWL